MPRRKEILKPFEENKVYMNKRINEGIEKNKKGTAKIKIIDKQGNIIKGAVVKATQKNHEFKYGANIFMLDELETSEKNSKYKELFKNAFNMATLPFYWDAVEPERGKTRYDKDSFKIYRRPAPDLCIEFCEENGIEPREHALAYEHFFPKWLKNADISEVKREFVRRCREISQRYADKIPTIEVTNETWWDTSVTSFYWQKNFIEWCFKIAEQFFPANKLAINEWSGLWYDSASYNDRYYMQIERALSKGARIDAVGMQFHMFYKAEEELKNTEKVYNPVHLYKILDKYGEFGLPIEITEVTVPAYSETAEDEDIQAEIIKNLYSVWFSHENTEQIIYWNLVDGYAAFAPQGDMASGENYYRGGLVRFDFTPKPAYYTIKNLFEKEWHTNETVISDEYGVAEFRGFYGIYTIDIKCGGIAVKKEIKLCKNTCNEYVLEI